MSGVALGSDDLELLQRFLDAWCEEHRVDASDEQAAEVASALFDWYMSENANRALLKADPLEMPPKPAKIQLLLRQLANL
ncbi:MAG TPA: hypothetical protein VFY63_09220 [Pseudorhizobium sp.]|nr:hypothetical protein [Pseudorhizobium sp.]